MFDEAALQLREVNECISLGFLRFYCEQVGLCGAV